MILLVNIPHTGTGFVVNGLFADYRRSGLEGSDPRQWDLCYTHFQRGREDWLKSQLSAHPSFTTYREGVRDSWAARSMDLDELDYLERMRDEMVDQFGMLPLRITDLENRDGDLAEISKTFGKRLATDWAPVASLGHVKRTR